MSKRMLLLVPLVILISAAIAFGGMSLYKKYTTANPVHYHAGFQVYIDGKLQDFSGHEFMKENPCSVDGTQHAGHEDEQLEKAHLHDRVGDVVHLHRRNVFWKDLFQNIEYKFPSGKEVKGFVNGQEVEDILNIQIKPYDSIVILIGENHDLAELLKKAVTKDAIIKAENKSENCGS